jgi:polyhydroxybutyrate depolymerase
MLHAQHQRLGLALLASCTLCVACTPTCEDGLEECFEVAEGRYLAFAPEDANPSDRLNLLIYFHGWSSTAETYAGKDWLRNGSSERDYLLVLPDGIDKTWAHVGSPSTARDELAFMDDVLSDVTDRWRISDVRAVAGFSQGGSMAWDLACYRADDYSAFIPASGGFWEPLPATCEQAVNLRHTHGTADTVIPLNGRPIGSSEQGNVGSGLDIFKETNGCPEAADRTESSGTLTCEIWDTCESGKEVRLCLHGGKHRLPSNYLPEALDWVESVSAP